MKKVGQQEKQETAPKGKNTRKVFISTVFIIFNLLAVFAASFAWFTMSVKGSQLETVSGDLNVSIEKIVAYKYVYPFYDHSTEFINYSGTGTVKGYAIEDSTINDTVSSNTATFTLGTDDTGTVAASATSLTPTNIYHDSTESWRYYLVGNDAFNGISSKSWQTSVGVPFSSKNSITTDIVEIKNVMISKGSEFILFDANQIDESNCTYLTYNTPSEANAPFKILEGNRIQCLKAGVYDFTYSMVDSTPTLSITKQSRPDDSIIGNNILDPIMINLDWRSSADPDDFPTPQSWLSEGIFLQNTTVILDVTLSYKNVNPVEAGLKVVRNSSASSSIYSLPNQYNNTTDHKIGYVYGGARNPLLASDFYTYYAVLAPAASAYGSGDAIWAALHQKTNVAGFSKFTNDGEHFDSFINCALHPISGDANDLIIPGTTTNLSNIYHCYIAIDYDYDHCKFFMDSNRLNKTYLLDRDIGFRLYGTQRLES